MADDGFLSRWSRRKAQARAGIDAPEPPAPPPEPPQQLAAESRPAGAGALPLAQAPPASPGATATVAAPTSDPDLPLPTLEDVARLTHEADFRPFLAPGVDENVKRAALKTMFQAPHFNVMDGLDVYIDDYGKPDPIPPEMLRQMVQSRSLRLFDDEDEAKDGAPTHPAAVVPAGEADARAGDSTSHPEASPDGVAAQDVPQSLPAPADPGPPSDLRAAADDAAAASDEDADLQLQPHDAAGRPGAS